MKSLQNIKNATDMVINLENGFIFASDNSETENYFQACLEIRKDGNGYKKEINASDCGYDDGICGDYNDSINASSEEHLIAFLKRVRQFGVKVV